MKFRFSLFVLLVGLGLSSCGQQRVYRASAEIISLRHSYIRAPSNNGSFGDQKWTQVEDETNVVLSREVLEPVVTELDLDYIWGQRLKTGDDTLSTDEATKHLKQVLEIVSDEQPLYMRSNSSFKIRITATGASELEAADIANAVAYHYKVVRDTAWREIKDEGLRSLYDQIGQQEKVVADANAIAAKNPHDSAAQQKVEVAKELLETLRIRLKQGLVDIEFDDSPVRILSRAVPPE